MSAQQTFVIVGAGLAGAKAAQTLREEGYGGRLVMVGAEAEPPYERPPLSKSYLQGGGDRAEVYVHAGDFYTEHDVELRTGVAASGLDTRSGELELDDGGRLAFDRLLISTGANPRRLSLPGSELDGIHYLRTLGDSDALRGRLKPGTGLVVIGAGWIGAEVAASARQRGADVVVLDPLSVPLERVLGTEVGAIYRDIHSDHGVQMRMGSGVEAFEGDGRVERVRTTDGTAIDCDTVVVGVGVVPAADLATQAGLATDNGVLVDRCLQTSAPNVFAAGDVANHDHPLLGRLRIEHWANALNQGPAAARNMLGADAPYDRLPYFFSDQYDVGMEYSGHAHDWDRVVFRGDVAKREFIAFWLREGRVQAAMNLNVWDVTDDLQALIRNAGPVDERRLTDPDVPLASLAEQHQAGDTAPAT